VKIAIITETFLPQTDGIVTRLCASIRWLRNEGHEVLVIAPDLGITKFEGVKVVGIPARSFFLYRDQKLALPNRKVGRSLSAFKPDLVHVVNPAVLGVAAVYYSRKGKWPLVASYHTHIPKYLDYYRVSILKPALWWFLRTLHNRADLNLCTSQSVASDLKDQRFRNIQVWKRGVDTDQFHPDNQDEEMRERLTNGQESKTLLLYVGRLAAEKKLENLRVILDKSRDFCLALVGDGPHRNRLEEHFKGTNTVFTGFLHGKELARAYASSDIFVFPSTTETLGLVILEAMSSRLPVVAVRGGPTSEQITDRESGMLYDPDDPEDLIHTIMKLRDPEMRFSIAQEGRKLSTRFGWSKSSKQLLDFYQQVLNERDGGWSYTAVRETGDN
jgi:glycosyltransferase involved in cell wall biosynthesis